MKRRVELHDSSLRDSIGDFVTLQMKSEELAEALELLDKAGFTSIDVFGGNAFMPTMTILGEDPWQRLRAIRSAVKNTPIQAVVRGRMLFGRWVAPDSTIRATLSHMKNLGVDRLKIVDAGLDLNGASRVAEMGKALGFHVGAAVSLSWGDAANLDEILMRSATSYSAAGADELSVQDPYGLLSPAQVSDAVRRHKMRSKLPLRLHFHDVNLLAVASIEEGLHSGALGADTTLSTLAWSYSPPQAESLVMALKGSRIDTGIDMAALERAAEWFDRAKTKKGFKYKAVYGVDHYLLRGGMPIAVRRALSDTLRDAGRMDIMERCWTEVPRIWETLGRPPLFSPMTQALCAQALLNVSTGNPYATLDYRVAAYLKGDFGMVPKEARGDLRQRASSIDTSRASLPLDIEKLPPDACPTEDDRLTYANFPAISDEFFRARVRARQNMPDTRFVGRAAHQAAPEKMPRRLMVNRHGETFEVTMMGMGPVEGSKRTIFLRIGGETATVEVTSPEEGAPPVYKLRHHGKEHTFEFVEVLSAGKRSLPVMIREDGKEEEILYSFPRS